MKAAHSAFVLLLASQILASRGARAAPAPSDESLCYVPGAGGGNPYTFHELPQSLARRNVPMVTFDVGARGSVQERAATFVRLLEAEIRRRPKFHCHMTAFSMGGIVTRYAMAHLNYRDRGVSRPVKERILSVTTIASPHRGTPLPKLLNRFTQGRYKFDAGDWQMNEEEIVRFNDPAQPETYSPIDPQIPFYSVRFWIDRDNEASNWIKRISFRLISFDLLNRKVDAKNDSVVPTESQGLGKILATLRLPHDHLAKVRRSSPSPDEFYERIWQNTQRPFRDGEFERGIRVFLDPRDENERARSFEELRAEDSLF